MSADRGTRRVLMLIVAASILAWIFVLWTAFHMDAPFVRLMMPMTASWTLPEAISVWIMWAVMMGAMMLPSAAPMILTHQRIAARKGAPGDNLIFTLAYILTLAALSLAGTVAQWGLQSWGLLTPMLKLNAETFSGIVLVLAGIAQWTSLKDSCLALCRTPAGFFATEWQDGRLGAFRMGLQHGLACLGCCWALMAVLFVFGVMNLAAIALLSTLVAAEKLHRHGRIIGRLGGLGFFLWGLWLILG